jgi:transitional endoplasmic reticulum ATPase
MTSKTLDTVNKPKIGVADVVHYGEKVTLPEKMDLDEAIDLLQRRKKYLTETVQVNANFKVFPYDGANALAQVLRKKYGWAQGTPIQSFFGDKPPQIIEVEAGVNKVIGVPWGQFEVPGTSIVMRTGGQFVGSTMQFSIGAQCKREDEATLQALFAEVRLECAANSIYRAQAIQIKFLAEDGDQLDVPEIVFMDTDIDTSKVIYAAPVFDALETSLFTPIRRIADLEANGLPFKSGILLGGIFGTGKTLAAKLASKYAVEAGITFIYCRQAAEITLAIQFARLYDASAAVVFCEDLDRVTSDKRDKTMDEILNVIDGIDAKKTRVMVVATTNDLHSINPAMLRPGRMDAVIEITPPDAEAVQRLIRAYGEGAIDRDEDLTAAGEALAGQIPAVIAEVVKRAKKAQLKRLEPGKVVTKLSSQAITESALTIKAQVNLLTPPQEKDPPELDTAMRKLIADHGKTNGGNVAHDTNRRVRRIEDKV